MSDSARDQANAIFDRHLDADFSLFACGDAGMPTETTLAAYEKAIGFPLPAEFRSFSLTSLGGVYIEVKETIWPRPKLYEVGPFWSALYGLFVYGFGDEIPEWMDARVKSTQHAADTGQTVAPFLKIMCDADFYCFDAMGSPRRWNHETDELEPVNGGFFDILELETANLRKRKEQKKRGE